MTALWPAYVRHGCSLFFVAVMRGPDMVALMPLVCRSAPPRLPLVRKLQFFGQEAGALALVNHCADIPMDPRQDPLEAMRAIKEFLYTQAANRWDVIELRWFFHESISRRAFEDVFDISPRNPFFSGMAIDLPTTSSELPKCFSKSTNTLFKRKTKQLTESGLPYAFDVQTVITLPLFNEIAEIHSARQSMLSTRGRRDRDALFDHPAARSGLKCAMDALAEAGRLRVHTLRIDRELAAFLLVFGHDGAACAWLTAFAPKFERLSPSRLLHYAMFAAEIERFGTRAIDFLPGFTPLKKELTNRRYEVAEYELVNKKRLRSRVCFSILDLSRSLRALARSMARGSELKTLKDAPSEARGN